MAGADRFDPYRILGVGRGATPGQLARAYRAQAKRLHPDLHGPDADRQMRELNRSWHILSDPARRRAWDAGHPAVTTANHWAGGSRSQPRAAPATPAAGTWSPWEAPAPAPADAGRVTVTDAWPRPRHDAPAVPAGVRDSGWLAAGVGAVLVVAIVALGWVASTNRAAATPRDAFRSLGIAPASSVVLDPIHVVAVYREDGGRLGVAGARLANGGWQAEVLEERAAAGEMTVLLAIDESGSDWRSVVYGVAPPGVARVRLSVAAVGGEVANGAWVIGARGPLRPQQLAWSFEDAAGVSLRSGSGELGGR